VADSDSDSFVLTHVQRAWEAGNPSTGTVLGANGMESAAGEIIYWLSNDSVKRMRGHVGRRVEVTGAITEVSKGTVQVQQEPGKSGPDNRVAVYARGKNASGETERPVEPGPPMRQGMKTRREEDAARPSYRRRHGEGDRADLSLASSARGHANPIIERRCPRSRP